MARFYQVRTAPRRSRLVTGQQRRSLSRVAARYRGRAAAARAAARLRRIRQMRAALLFNRRTGGRVPSRLITRYF
jgi:hypothetical protein